jgi:ATP-dependent Clp protease protease subunit|tara:strand:+ start:4030 stop:5082 length:1053 start_codon:yes stop_codon:yes gene_type:complete
MGLFPLSGGGKNRRGGFARAPIVDLARGDARAVRRRRDARRVSSTRSRVIVMFTASVGARVVLNRANGTASSRRDRSRRPSSGARGTSASASTMRVGAYGGFVNGNRLAGALRRGDGRTRCETFAERAWKSMKTSSRGGRAGERRTKTMMPIGVPRVPYKTPNENMWQWVDIWNCLYRERIIWIGQTIDEELGNQLVATMLFLDSVDRGKPMYLYINSEGGNIVPTMAIMDTMKYLNSEVGTVGFGSARAMGGLLLASGAKGKRAALPNTCIMLHHPSGVARGSASDIHNEGKELMRIRKQINEKVSAITGRSMEQVSEEIRRDKHFTPEEALDYGIIDKVLYRPRTGAR